LKILARKKCAHWRILAGRWSCQRLRKITYRSHLAKNQFHQWKIELLEIKI